MSPSHQVEPLHHGKMTPKESEQVGVVDSGSSVRSGAYSLCLWRSALRAVERSGECGSTHREAEPSAGRGPIATATANFYRRARTRRSKMP